MKKQKTIKSGSTKTQSNNLKSSYARNPLVVVIIAIIGTLIVFSTLILLILLFVIQVDVISQTSSYAGNSSNISAILAHNKELIRSLRAVQNYTLTIGFIIAVLTLIKIMLVKNKLVRVVVGSAGISFALFTIFSASYSETIVKHFINIAVK